MQVTRMELDGAGSPMALVTKILKAEPGLTIPVPIEELAVQLDITEIRDVAAAGFLGGLITDADRSSGFILVNKSAFGGRRRFTIGHELGHFLMTHHKAPPEGFKCSQNDMRAFTKQLSGAARWEVEANEFSSLILMPPPIWRIELGKFGDPDLAQIEALARAFDVSKEAAARTYAQYHGEPIAVVVVKEGKIQRSYRSMRFPKFGVGNGDAVPPSSIVFHMPAGHIGPSNVVESRAGNWLESDWGKPLPGLYEQAVRQRDGYALILLWADEVDEENDQGWGEKTAKQRLQAVQERWGR